MKKTKMFLTTILLVASTWLVKAQAPTPCTVNPCASNPPPTCENVCNGSFEVNNTDPTALGAPYSDQIRLSCGWFNSNTSTTPDYYTGTTSYTMCKIPCNYNGKEPERTGKNAYAGFLASSGTNNLWCERIGSKLTTTLTPGKEYEVSFWLSLAETSLNNEINNVGFTIGPDIGPSIYSNPIIPVNTSSVTCNGWTKMTATWIQDGGTTTAAGIYIIIGSFYDFTFTPNSFVTASGGTSTISCSQSYTQGISTYYFIDDVSVKEIFPLTVTASQTTGCIGETFSLTATGGANNYFWSPSTGLSCTNCANPVSTATTSITYTVTGTSTASCVYTSATIAITPTACCANVAANNITFRNVNIVPYLTSGATPWTSLTTGGFYTGNIAVPSTTTSTSIITKTLTVIGSMSVNANVTFSLCNIAIDQDISIKQYSTTTIDHSFLFGPCGLWEGIKSYAKLQVTNSWIEDGYFAIVVGGVTTHAGLQLDNVLFNKNYTGLAAATTSMNPTDFSITGSIFSSRNFGAANYTTTTRYTTLFPNLNAKVPAKIKGSVAHSITASTIRSNGGVLLWGIVSNTTTNFFTIGAVTTGTPPNSDYSNYFDYMNYGIYNLTSKASVINNLFGNMITNSTGTAIGAVVHDDGSNNPSITKTLVGSNTGGSNYKNYFGYVTATSTILDGVVAFGGGTLSVNNNDFRSITRYGVSVKSWAAGTPTNEPVTVASNSYTDAAYAFYGYNNSSIEASVQTNTVTQSQTIATYTAYTNVYLDEINKPTTAVYHIHDNVFSGSLKGVYALNTRGTRIINNRITIGKPGTGVFNADITIDNSDYCVVAQNTVDCNPTNSSSWNTIGIISNAAANNTYKCNIISKVGNCLKFQYSCPSSTIYNNTLNNAPSDPCAVGLVLLSCSSIGDIGFPTGGGYGQSDDFWGDFSQADTYCQTSSNYTPTIGKIYFDAGKAAASYSPQVNLNTYTASVDYSKSFVPTSTTQANTGGCNEAARMINTTSGGGKNGNSNTGEINSGNTLYDSNSEIVSNYQPGDLLKGRKRILIYNANHSSNRSTGNNNEDRFYEIDSLLMLYAQTKDISALNSAKSVNTAITAIGMDQQNQKDFNAIHATYLESDSLVTSEQIQDLKNMAYLCPATNGLAVYQARGLIRNWDDSTEYYNECEHIIPDLANPIVSQRLLSNTINNPVSAKLINLYPNPSNGRLIVENSPENSIFELYDIVGRKIYTNTLSGTATQLDISSFNNGTYLYKISQNGKPLKEDKLIINK